MSRFISDFVQVDDLSKKVTIYARPNWIEVEDLEAWIAAFYDAVRDVSSEIEGPFWEIESLAFDRVT